jgi:hypothetical protein
MTGDDEFDIGEAMLKKRLDEEEEPPSDCGGRGKRCRWIASHCDYHVDRGDWEYHRMVDKELEK